MSKILTTFAALLLLAQGCVAQVDLARIRKNAKEAQIILVAEILAVGPKPGFWSGQFEAFQEVHYEVVSVLKGKLTRKEILAKHPVVKNSETSDVIVPRLSTRLFFKGNKVILFLDELTEHDMGKLSICLVHVQFRTYDEDFGVVPATPELLDAVNKSL